LLRWSDYREVGELKGALAKHAEDTFNTLQPAEQKAFPLVMGYLVTLGQGEEEVPNRRTAPYRDIIESTGHDQQAGAKGFLDLFIEKRLLVADTDPQGEVTVTVAHEALLREWQRVKEWLTENREVLRMRDRLDLSLKAASAAADLISAAERGDAAAVQAFLAKGAEVNATASNGATALIVASYNGHLEVVQALQAKGPTSMQRKTTAGPR
jgi:hypothetical protein